MARFSSPFGGRNRTSYYSTDSTIAPSMLSRKTSLDLDVDPALDKETDQTAYASTAASQSVSRSSSTMSDPTLCTVRNSLRRMENKQLDSQRFTVNETKAVHMHSVALGARINHALERRMTNQDAVFTRPASPPKLAASPPAGMGKPASAGPTTATQSAGMSPARSSGPARAVPVGRPVHLASIGRMFEPRAVPVSVPEDRSA